MAVLWRGYEYRPAHAVSSLNPRRERYGGNVTTRWSAACFTCVCSAFRGARRCGTFQREDASDELSHSPSP